MRSASSAASSLSVTRSTWPVTSACRSLPPSWSAVTSSLIATDVTLGLDTEKVASRRITAKSDSTAYQVPMP